MERRVFLGLTAAALTFPVMGQAAIHYKPGLVKELLAEGKTVIVDFTTEWCPTCAAQKRTISALRGQNSAYDDNLVFVTVDFDIYGNQDSSNELKIPRRSTIVALHGDQELARIVAGTAPAQIQKLLDAALAAATA